MNVPPGGQPVYRLITGADDPVERRVSEALGQGYKLHGSPAVTSTTKGSVFIVQALMWPGELPPAGDQPGEEQHSAEEDAPRRLAYSIQEVAHMFGVSRDLVNDLLASGQLRSVKVGKRRLIPVDAVEEFLDTAE